MASVPILQHFAVHSTQAIFLKEVARRGGEIAFDWEKAREDVRGMVADLLQKQIVRYVEYVTSADQAKGVTFLLLTDTGRRVVSQLEEAEGKQTEIQSGAAEVKVTA